jgi:hypothetical protein
MLLVDVVTWVVPLASCLSAVFEYDATDKPGKNVSGYKRGYMRMANAVLVAS